MHRDFDHFFKSVRLRRKKWPGNFPFEKWSIWQIWGIRVFYIFRKLSNDCLHFFLSLAIWRISNYIKRSKIQKWKFGLSQSLGSGSFGRLTKCLITSGKYFGQIFKYFIKCPHDHQGSSLQEWDLTTKPPMQRNNILQCEDPWKHLRSNIQNMNAVHWPWSSANH